MPLRFAFHSLFVLCEFRGTRNTFERFVSRDLNRKVTFFKCHPTIECFGSKVGVSLFMAYSIVVAHIAPHKFSLSTVLDVSCGTTIKNECGNCIAFCIPWVAP